MENENKENQNKNSSNSNSNSGQKKQSGSDASVLTLLQPHDMSRTVESALHVFQGKQDKLPDLMQDIGNIILRATRRYSTTQLILAAGALTIGAVLLAKYSDELDFGSEAE
jgi:hypothetical protein